MGVWQAMAAAIPYLNHIEISIYFLCCEQLPLSLILDIATILFFFHFHFPGSILFFLIFIFPGYIPSFLPVLRQCFAQA